LTKTPPIARLLAAVRTDTARRIFALVVLSLGTGALVGEYGREPVGDLKIGGVAERSIRAADNFPFVDREATLERQRAAEVRVKPVFDFDTTLSGRTRARVEGSFEMARHRLAASGTGEDVKDLSRLRADFLAMLGLSLDAATMDRVLAQGFSQALENLTIKLANAELGRFTIANRALLPDPARPISVVRILADSQDEISLDSFSNIVTPDEARRAIKMAAFDMASETLPADARMAAVALASAAVRTNFSYNQLITEDRRREAREGVADVVIQVQRGTSIVREGEVISQAHFETLQAMKESRGSGGSASLFAALSFFSGLLFFTLYAFASGFIKKFSTRPGDIEASAFLVLVVLGLARLIVETSEPLSHVIGVGMPAESLWYLAPVAGGTMLVRILVNSETALVWVVATSLMTGLLLDASAIYTIFFLCSGLVAASGIAYTKERVNVLRGGLLTGLVNAAVALLISLMSVQLGEQGYTSAAQPLWNMGMAFLAGNLSAIMVLGMVPMFEVFGFVTDYKLLELTNLNHPLLRQLMLRAPGSYHHSVIVGSLAEAGAESIGCNALMTRVSCYFHDIGKAVKPNYFIENLRDMPNPHDRLAPHQSARIIINHVLDGQALAKQYKLPKPILDGIMMHHGTGIVQYFYAKAVEAAEEGMVVDPDDFRYPGELPSTREAGIIFLADRVEAACRTLEDPSRENIRLMIQGLVNGAVTDGQLVQCPLTISELYAVMDTFTETLLGIYHHRIEYPGMPVLPPKGDTVSKSAIITLDVAAPETTETTEAEGGLSLSPTPEA
jgi:cyclic-di-AMP phosphodiesterase PgpH